MILNKGDKFTLDRFRNGDIKAYVVQRICRRHINVKSEDHTEHFAMSYDRIKDINPIPKRIEDDIYNKSKGGEQP